MPRKKENAETFHNDSPHGIQIGLARDGSPTRRCPEALTFTGRFMSVCRGAAKYRRTGQLDIFTGFTQAPCRSDDRDEIEAQAAWEVGVVKLLGLFWEQMRGALYETGSARWLRELADAVEDCAQVSAPKGELRPWLLARFKPPVQTGIPPATIEEIKKTAEERFRRIFPVGVIRSLCDELAIPRKPGKDGGLRLRADRNAGASSPGQ